MFMELSQMYLRSTELCVQPQPLLPASTGSSSFFFFDVLDPVLKMLPLIIDFDLLMLIVLIFLAF